MKGINVSQPRPRSPLGIAAVKTLCHQSGVEADATPFFVCSSWSYGLLQNITRAGYIAKMANLFGPKLASRTKDRTVLPASPFCQFGLASFRLQYSLLSAATGRLDTVVLAATTITNASQKAPKVLSCLVQTGCTSIWPPYQRCGQHDRPKSCCGHLWSRQILTLKLTSSRRRHRRKDLARRKSYTGQSLESQVYLRSEFTIQLCLSLAPSHLKRTASPDALSNAN